MTNKRLQKILAYSTATLVVLMIMGLSISIARADDNGTAQTSSKLIINPLKDASTIEELLKLILNKVVLPIGGVIAVIFIIYSGFLFVTAQGNEDRLTKARDAFFQAVVGAAILLGSVAIMDLIINTLNTIKKSAAL